LRVASAALAAAEDKLLKDKESLFAQIQKDPGISRSEADEIFKALRPAVFTLSNAIRSVSNQDYQSNLAHSQAELLTLSGELLGLLCAG
jgi:hypothetical protein